MRNYKPFFLSVLFFIISIFLSASRNKDKEGRIILKMPYKNAGLTERQAAAHLLDRFTFGATPGAVDEVVNTGLEKWFIEQLDGKLNDNNLEKRLQEYDALTMNNEQVL